MLAQWLLEKLAALKDERLLLIRDSQRLLPEADGAIHRFAIDNGFTVIIASTNLSFRMLYEKTVQSSDANKLLIIDRAPLRRRSSTTVAKAPPPFYPDLLAQIPVTARLEVSLRQFLIEKTGDPYWPKEANDPQFARLISRNLTGVLKAHANLRAAAASRFTDHDFKTIVAYAALGVPDAAFKRPEARTYWHIALLGAAGLEELDQLAPEVAQSIRAELRHAPRPFCWFADHAPETILRAFYLAAILAQHFDHWKLLLASIDPELKPFSDMETSLVQAAAADLIALDPMRAHQDLQTVENALSVAVLRQILLEQMHLDTGKRFAGVIEKEHYSILIRSLALLMALDDLLAPAPLTEAHEQLTRLLADASDARRNVFVDQRPSEPWDNLKSAYQRLRAIQEIDRELALGLRTIKVKPDVELSLAWFRGLWNDRRVNRLEYYLSALERLVFSADFLARPADQLPSAFVNAAQRIKDRLISLRREIENRLGELNRRFQDLVLRHYPSWLSGPSELRLTSQFLERVVKPYRDPERESALVFVFDGMRYDIWDELVRPVFEERMEIIAEFPGLALLPSETHLSRKAIFAAAFPDHFDTRKGEDVLLQGALQQIFGYRGEVQVLAPEGLGTGETVRYRAGTIDFYIFELCDKELHKIQNKTLPDGRTVPGRPMAFIYQQHIKNIIDTEVTAILRNLPPETKVFVAADHGFGAVGRQPLHLDLAWLNEPGDCNYQNAYLRQSLAQVNAPQKVRANSLEIPIEQLRLSGTAEGFDRTTRQSWHKSFATVVFPRTGYALARPQAHFNPDAYSHGGISLPELLVPMVVLQVKTPDQGLLLPDAIVGISEIIEGETAEFRLPIRFARAHPVAEVRIEATAVYQKREETPAIPAQVQYLTAPGGDIVFRFIPDLNDASDAERLDGKMTRTLKIGIHYRDGQRLVDKSCSIDFRLQLNPARIVRRVPTSLGRILGMTPKNLR